ncbi:hypothetical protein [Saccharomonospora sp. NB11]|jgi:hypothetical protein|uniref:hypothetical protein n=1 Tax=Saccharomonospora sp. NB11 TaxID=1642298 RepID=UPI0018D06C2C|nr:hypothetical protein [Saccharomonospora sp. NB11]
MTIASVRDVRTIPSETENHVARRPARRARLAPVASVAVGTALIGAHASAYGYWIIDDAAITFSYARSVAEGLGPVLQPGAPAVEGYSNPTWLLLLVLGRLVGLFDHGLLFGIPDYVLFPKALALLCCAAILTLSYVAARRVLTTAAWVVPLAMGGVLAAMPSFVIWAFSGLENPLYALLLVTQAVVLFLAVVDGRLLTAKVAVTVGALAALAALTRPEGLIYAGSYPLVVLAQLRRAELVPSLRRCVESSLVFLVPVGAYFTWRYVTFGQWLSMPSVAKAQDLPTLVDLVRPGELVSYVGALAVLFAAAMVAAMLARGTWWRAGLLAVLVPLGLAVVAYAVLEPDWMAQYRFATPVWVLGTLAATLATVEVVRSARTRVRAWLVAGLVAVLLPTGAGFVHASEQFRAQPDISACYVADRLGRVFNGYADVLGLEEASLLIPDLGGSSLTSRLDLVDMAGLTHATFAEMARTEDRRAQAEYVYTVAKPTFIHIREPWTSGTGLGWDPRLERDYYPIHYHTKQGEPHGDWVRKSVVPDAETLAELRDYATTSAAWVEQRLLASPLRQCGPTLHRGQTELSEPNRVPSSDPVTAHPYRAEG